MVVISDYLDIKSIKFRKLVDGEPIIVTLLESTEIECEIE
jgi:uncharacterized membrane protein YcaP (DUF421 family)